MKTLIEQFCDIVQIYLDESGDLPANVAGYILAFIDGQGTVKAEDALSPEQLARIDPESITPRDRTGTHGISHLRQRLCYLSHEEGISEAFLIPSVIRKYERFLTTFLLNHDEGMQNRIDIIKTFQTMLDSSSARDEWYDYLENSFARKAPSSDEDRIAEVKESLTSLRRMFSSVEPIEVTRHKLQSWRDLTREIISDEYISRYINDIAVQWLRQGIVED